MRKIFLILYSEFCILSSTIWSIAMTLRLLTAGESHGEAVLAVLDGFPAGLAIDADAIDRDLARRQSGYGRGARMSIERDRVRIAAGVRKGRTIGAPVVLVIANRDRRIDEAPDLFCPRPGHADLAGRLKHGASIRDVLERASARETAARVAAGSLCRQLLGEIGVAVGSHVVMLGGVEARVSGALTPERLARADRSAVRVLDPAAEKKMTALIDAARRRGDTLGGRFEVIAFDVPAGLGSHAQWDRKLDGRLAQALMSNQAIKAVEIGLGVEAGARSGSRVHDPIHFTRGRNAAAGGFWRPTNNAGGIEGGISNGMPIVARVTMKPISTLMKPLASVDIRTHKPARASVERSDVVALPAASVVGECVVAQTLAEAVIECFGGDAVRHIRERVRRHLERMAKA
jgi:chorismate synthase